jgi:PAS domain S-box-containing protein
MDRLLRIPIRWQLIIMVVIVALPAAGIIIYSGVQQRNNAIHNACVDTQRLVDQIASEQRILVAAARPLVVSLSQLPELKNKDSAKLNLILSNILKLNPNFTVLFIADRKGVIWASTLVNPYAKPIMIDDRRYFKNALATGQLSSGEFQVGRISKKRIQDFGYPYKDSHGKIAGVVGVGIPLERYGVILKKAKLPANADMVLIDYKGIILYSASDPVHDIGKLSNPVLFKQMVQGPDADTSVAGGVVGDAPRHSRYVSYQKVRLDGERLPYMYIRVGIPLESALSQANELMAKNISWFSLVLASALLLAWLVGKRSISDRIAVLEKASQSLARGELQIRVSDLIKGGELGRLGESFDAMAGQLASREERLSENQRFLNAIIDTEPECLKMLDSNGRVLMMNPAGLKMVEAETFEQVKMQSIYPFITAEFRDIFMAFTNDVFQGKAGNLLFELVGLRGGHVWLETHAVPFRDDSGKIVSLLGVTRDITDQVVTQLALAEKQRLLNELNVNLEQRIVEAVSDSREKDRMLIQQGRQAAMGEMIGNIAHQWRQPLNTLGLIVQELQMTYGRDESYKESLGINCHKAMSLINHMSKTIDDFSNYFKPTKEKTLFNVSNAISETVALIEPSLKNQNIKVDLRSKDDTTILGYANEYPQVLLNILLNCRDAFEECHLDSPRVITITVSKENDRSVVTIADNAGGIPEAVLDKIFDPYFTTKGPDKGTGIGLYMAKIIVEKNMGGRLTVRNGLNGAEFRIEI